MIDYTVLFIHKEVSFIRKVFILTFQFSSPPIKAVTRNKKKSYFSQITLLYLL